MELNASKEVFFCAVPDVCSLGWGGLQGTRRLDFRADLAAFCRSITPAERKTIIVSAAQVNRTLARFAEWREADPIESRAGLSYPDAETLTAPPGAEKETDSPAGVVLELIRQRSAPGLFVVGPDNRVLYANEQSLKLFKDLSRIPEKVEELCNRVRAKTGDASAGPSGIDCEVLRGPGESLYSLRGFIVKGRKDAPSHVMVLVERVAERGPVNLRKAKTEFGLSNREIEVVTLLAQGLCNKEIGARLYVSEHTVKGHLKNITRKVGAESRGAIVAILK